MSSSGSIFSSPNTRLEILVKGVKYFIFVPQEPMTSLDYISLANAVIQGKDTYLNKKFYFRLTSSLQKILPSHLDPLTRLFAGGSILETLAHDDAEALIMAAKIHTLIPHQLELNAILRDADLFTSSPRSPFKNFADNEGFSRKHDIFVKKNFNQLRLTFLEITEKKLFLSDLKTCITSTPLNDFDEMCDHLMSSLIASHAELLSIGLAEKIIPAPLVAAEDTIDRNKSDISEEYPLENLAVSASSSIQADVKPPSPDAFEAFNPADIPGFVEDDIDSETVCKSPSTESDLRTSPSSSKINAHGAHPSSLGTFFLDTIYRREVAASVNNSPAEHKQELIIPSSLSTPSINGLFKFNSNENINENDETDHKSSSWFCWSLCKKQ